MSFALITVAIVLKDMLLVVIIARAEHRLVAMAKKSNVQSISITSSNYRL